MPCARNHRHRYRYSQMPRRLRRHRFRPRPRLYRQPHRLSCNRRRLRRTIEFLYQSQGRL